MESISKIMVLVAALGVTLCAWAVDYTLAEGESDTMPEGTNVFDKVTVKGDLTILARSVVRTGGGTSKVYFTGGSVLVGGEGSYFGAANYDASASGNCQINFGQRGSDGRYGSLTVGAGGTIGLGVVSLGATSSQNPPVGTPRLEFLTVRDGGMFHVRSMSNSSKLPAQITLAGATASFGSSTSYYSTRMSGGPFVYRLQDNVDFAYNINYGSWNTSNTVVTTEGEGNITLINNTCSAETGDSYRPICFQPGAKFDHTGDLAFSRPGSGSNWGEFSVFASGVFGSNLTGLFVRRRSGVNAYLRLRFAENVTNELKTIESDYKDNTIKVYGAGTLRIGADTGASRMDVDGFVDGCTTEVEKIGGNELLLSKTPSIPALRISAGKVRFPTDCTVGNLALNGGTFVINDGAIVCFDDGLSGLTGKIEKGDGTAWAEGEYVICYFKGENPDFDALTADTDFRCAPGFSAVSVEDGDYAGYKKLVLTVTSRVKTIRITESGEVDLKALMGDDALTKVWGVEIAAGVTVANTTALEGLGVEVTGGGTLALGVESPDYSGAVSIEGTTIRISVSNPFGTGAVTIDGATLLEFVGDNNKTFPNELTVVNSTDDSVVINNTGNGCVTFKGAITATGGVGINSIRGVNASSFQDETYLVFEKEITCSTSANIRFQMQGAAELHGKVTANTLFAYGGGSKPTLSAPILHFYATNSIGRIYSRWDGKFICEAEGLFAGKTYLEYNNGQADGELDLKTFDQEIKYVTGAGKNSRLVSVSASEEGATLMLSGQGVRSVTNCRLTGGLGLTVDSSDGTLSQTFAGLIAIPHTMTGPITVKSGALTFKDETTLVNVPTINVEGGALNLTTTADGAFAGVKNLAISGGTFTVDGTGADPFGALANTKTVVSLSGEGKLSLADGVTATVYRACTNGFYLKKGEYTGVGSTANAIQLPQLSGNGVLKVRTSGPGTVLIVH